MPNSRDGSHDFDDEIGTWHTRLSVLRGPLTGAGEWVDYVGTTVVRPVWQGAANLVELDARSTSGGHLRALSLRLYDEETRTWSLHFASHGSGEMGPPAIGAFDGAGRGEFRSVEQIGDRSVDVLFVITRANADSWTFEQSFSADGGATWELNWTAVDNRSDPLPHLA